MSDVQWSYLDDIVDLTNDMTVDDEWTDLTDSEVEAINEDLAIAKKMLNRAKRLLDLGVIRYNKKNPANTLNVVERATVTEYDAKIERDLGPKDS